MIFICYFWIPLAMRIVFLLISCLLFCSVVAQVDNDSLITVLKKEIEQRDIYVNQKLGRIEELKQELHRSNPMKVAERFDLYNRLYHEYKTFIYDSAFKYSQRLLQTAKALNDKSAIGYARVKIAFILISSGMFKETFDSLKMVDPKYIPDSSKVDFYRLLSRAYSDLNIYNNDNYYRDYYQKMDKLYMDSALQWTEPKSYSYFYLTAVKKIGQGDYQGTIDTEEELLKTHKLSNPQLAVNYYDLGNAHGALGRPDLNIRYKILSSLSDLRAATRETASMHALAGLLFRQGDITNSYVFIKQALDDANAYGARQRKVQISSTLQQITAARISSADYQRKFWLTFSAGLTVLIALIVSFAFIIYRQNKKLKAAEIMIRQTNFNLQEINHKLIEADRIKEEYIGYYFNHTSDYIDKIETLKKNIDSKIQLKKNEEIKYIVNGINPALEREQLYANFDKVFLKLFPDFVDVFNSYFKGEDQLSLKDGQLLNTEMRIFALMRLGIQDAEKIAKILGYSVNTIYAYKNRVKSKSVVANDVFEQKIMEIMSVPVVPA
jgi:hypothetical protein